MDRIEGSVQGGVAFWSSGPTRRELLQHRLELLGLQEYLPAERPEMSALKEALSIVARDQASKQVDYIIQPHDQQGKNGYDVLAVERGEQKNAYHVDFGVKAEACRIVETHGCIPYAWHGDLERLFRDALGKLTGSSVSSFLVKMLGLLNGVTLREAGGVYWIPPRSIERWEQITRAVEASGIEEQDSKGSSKPANRCYLMTTPMNQGTLRAVRDSVNEQIAAEARMIAEELATGELGEKALENRKGALKRLESQVSEYEGILGEGLGALREVVQNVQQSAVVLAAIAMS